jgi:NADH dehydrogenase [ubiquinone] 1 alpha subcomplex assembly factor 7
VPPQPTIVIANEFLDTLPIAQLVLADGAWRARVVTLGDDGDLRLALDSAGAAAPAPLPAPPQEGDILETCAAHASLAAALGARAALGPLAALLIDYGHAATGYGDTLQGIAGQRAVSPLEAPGETDLSAHVDFQSFGAACRDAGLGVDGPLPQGEFLGRLGIVERASRLMAANPAKAAALEAGVARLLAPTGMGSRFLALGVRSQTLAPLPGLADSR